MQSWIKSNETLCLCCNSRSERRRVSGGDSGQPTEALLLLAIGDKIRDVEKL